MDASGEFCCALGGAGAVHEPQDAGEAAVLGLFVAAGVVVGVGVAFGQEAGEGFGAHVDLDEPVVVPGAVVVGASEVGGEVGPDESGFAAQAGVVAPAGGFGLDCHGDASLLSFTECQVAVGGGEGVAQEAFGWFVGAPGVASVRQEDAGSGGGELPDL